MKIQKPAQAGTGPACLEKPVRLRLAGPSGPRPHIDRESYRMLLEAFVLLGDYIRTEPDPMRYAALAMVSNQFNPLLARLKEARHEG